MTRLLIICLLAPAFLAGAAAWAAEDGPAATAAVGTDPARAQVEAATANAFASLRSDIRASRITPTLTVAQFLKQTGSDDALDETVQRAQQIGGPRWIDDQTCQVKLELSGARVARSLISVAAVRPRQSPLPAVVLEQRLADWKYRSFSATGTSISADKVQSLRPADDDAWAGVSDDLRGQAVASARQDAVQRVLSSIGPIELGPGQTVADALARPQVGNAVANWLSSRPITQVRFRDDLDVEMTMAAQADELFSTFRAAAEKVPQIKLPDDPASLDRLRDEFRRRMAGAVGHANARSGHGPVATQMFVLNIPAEPPEWIAIPLDAEAVAEAAGSKLRTAWLAQSKAMDGLRTRIGALTLSRGQTIDQAAQKSPRVAEAIQRALLRARVYKVEYRADGSVLVRVMIDPRDVWEELRDASSLGPG